MELYILNNNFAKLAVLDTFESVLWVDRYDRCGEIEIYLPADMSYLDYIKQGNYVVQRDSEHVMIIEGIRVDTSVDNGNHFTITGRSIESILDRRIIWKQTDIDNTKVQTVIKRLLNENVISPSIAERAIPNIIFEDTDDSYIDSLSLSGQWTGDNLYEVICDICNKCSIGFKMFLNNSNQFVFKLYSGKDRSYNQSSNFFVVFSPKFDNIINSNYYESDKEYKNITLVAGEGEGLDRKTVVVGSGSGLERRELYTDARDISNKDDEGEDIPIAEYNAMLSERGSEKLAECAKVKTFDGKTDVKTQFIYGEDFFMGDIVQVRNEYGLEGAARITEFIMSENTSDGLEYYPTFEAIDDTEV